MAMHLVHWALDGVVPPPILPPPLADCVEMMVNGSLPVMEDKHILKCQMAFLAFNASIATGTLRGMQ